MWLCSPDLSGLQNRERSQVKWDEYSQLTPEQTCTQQRTVSAHSSLSGLRGGRGFGAWKWIDGAQEVSCPSGGKLKLLKEQSDKTVCCPSPFFSPGSTLWADSVFYVFDRQGLALTMRLKCRQLQSLPYQFSLCTFELSESFYSDYILN